MWERSANLDSVTEATQLVGLPLSLSRAGLASQGLSSGLSPVAQPGYGMCKGTFSSEWPHSLSQARTHSSTLPPVRWSGYSARAPGEKPWLRDAPEVPQGTRNLTIAGRHPPQQSAQWPPLALLTRPRQMEQMPPTAVPSYTLKAGF